jgi:CHASE3 domain sensor protein
MKFTFKMGIYLVVATTIATLVAIGGAYQLSVTERVEQAKAEAQSQRIIAKLEELVRAKEAAESATLNYLVSRLDQDLEQLRKAGASRDIEIAHLAEFVAGNAVERRRATRAS